MRIESTVPTGGDAPASQVGPHSRRAGQSGTGTSISPAPGAASRALAFTSGGIFRLSGWWTPRGARGPPDRRADRWERSLETPPAGRLRGMRGGHGRSSKHWPHPRWALTSLGLSLPRVDGRIVFGKLVKSLKRGVLNEGGVDPGRSAATIRRGRGA
jgi:hypothetical protein